MWKGSTQCKLLLLEAVILCFFEGGHKGTKVISSGCCKPPWAKDGKTFICRHNYKKGKKKKKSVFRNAEQSSAEQSRFKEKERGAPSPGLNRVLNRHPHRLFWESGTVTAWAGVCKEMAADEKEPNPQNAWEKYQSEATNSWHFVVSPMGDMIIYCIKGTLQVLI